MSCFCLTQLPKRLRSNLALQFKNDYPDYVMLRDMVMFHLHLWEQLWRRLLNMLGYILCHWTAVSSISDVLNFNLELIGRCI